MLNIPENRSVPVARGTVEGAILGFWQGPLGDGEIRGPNVSFDAELLMNATIEPDADKDGFGDETQDRCRPADAATQGDCRTPTLIPPTVIPAEPAPQTTIRRGPSSKVAANEATFRFVSSVSGSSFQCKLDKKPWRGCKSPRTYRGLIAGKHRFKVRAIGPTGVPDPTPAKRSFTVEL